MDDWFESHPDVRAANTRSLIATLQLRSAKTARKVEWVGEVRRESEFLTDTLRSLIRADKTAKSTLRVMTKVARMGDDFRAAVLQRVQRVAEESAARIQSLYATAQAVMRGNRPTVSVAELPTFVEQWVTDVMAERSVMDYHGLVNQFIAATDVDPAQAEIRAVEAIVRDIRIGFNVPSGVFGEITLYDTVFAEIRSRVFVRDPEGGVNLRAMARDAESVHRSSVLGTTESAIHCLMTEPVPSDQNTIKEFGLVLDGYATNPFADKSLIMAVRDEFRDDYTHITAFNVSYGALADHVWAYIRAHEHRDGLIQRFMEEAIESIGMCATGKMTRLANVLSGFHAAVGILASPMEIFRGRFALLMNRPASERASGAKDLFEEFHIPAEEQEIWMEPLMA